MRSLVALTVAMLLCASCAKGTPTNPILPEGVSPTPLPQPAYVGIGRYSKLAETTAPQTFGGIPFINFVEVQQSADSTITHRDEAGFVYALKGRHTVSWNDGERQKSWDEGTADWVNPDAAHLNLSSADTTWYLVAFRSIGLRGASLPYSNYRTLYTTSDLTPPLPGKNLVHQLGLITMDPGGRTSAHSHGGVEAFYVMKGTVELALNNGTRTKITVGQGASVRPGLIMQLHVVGDEPVQILTYFVTAEGQPWQTNLQTLP